MVRGTGRLGPDRGGCHAGSDCGGRRRQVGGGRVRNRDAAGPAGDRDLRAGGASGGGGVPLAAPAERVRPAGGVGGVRAAVLCALVVVSVWGRPAGGPGEGGGGAGGGGNDRGPGGGRPPGGPLLPGGGGVPG